MAARQAGEEFQAVRKRYQRPSLVKGPVLADVTAQKTVSGIPSDK